MSKAGSETRSSPDISFGRRVSLVFEIGSFIASATNMADIKSLMIVLKYVVSAFDGTMTGSRIKSGQCPLYSEKDILSLVAK